MPRAFSDRAPAFWDTRKPGPDYQLELDPSGPLARGLRMLVLFGTPGDGYADLVRPDRRFVHYGSIVTSDGRYGDQALATITAVTGVGAAPYSAIQPSDAPTADYTVSALVLFDGTDPTPGAYGANGAALVGDGTSAGVPLYSWSGGNAVFHVPSTQVAYEVGGIGASGTYLSPSQLSGWHRLTLVSQGATNTATLLVDGGRTFTGLATALPSFAPSTFLGLGPSWGSPISWPWPTADFFYWGRALSTAECSAHAASPWRSSLRPRFGVRAEAIPGGVSPPPQPPSDRPTLDGVGRLYAEASVLPPETKADVGGFGFVRSEMVLRARARATLVGDGTVFGDPWPTATTADVADTGSLAATARLALSASASLGGAGTVAPSPNVKLQAITAALGVGGISADGTWVESPYNAHANLGGTASVSCTARTLRAARASVGASGFATTDDSKITWVAGSSRAIIQTESHFVANALVLRRPLVQPARDKSALPNFYCVEIETYVPGIPAVVSSRGHGTHAHGTLSQSTSGSPEFTSILLASDMGYRTSASDPGGVKSYPPILDQAFQINAQLNLEPDKSPAAAAWGSILLVNVGTGSSLNRVSRLQNCDGRRLTVLRGMRGWDAARQYEIDPAYGALKPAFTGLGTAWSLNETELEIPLRDATYFLERVLPIPFYGGNGGLDGTQTLANKPIPYCRGGTAASPICNISPVLVDPNNLIFQYNNGPGTVVNLYEGGANQRTDGTKLIPYAGDITALGWADIYSGTVPAGSYVTHNAKGLFRLRGNPAYQITADVTGAFPYAGAWSNPFAIARYLLSEDVAVPSSYIDTASFDSAAGIYAGSVAGFYVSGGDQAPTGISVVNAILTGMGASVVPTRYGTLKLFMLRAILRDWSPHVFKVGESCVSGGIIYTCTVGGNSTSPPFNPPTSTGAAFQLVGYGSAETVKQAMDASTIVQLTPTTLPASLYPPRYRFKVGYNHNYTIQTSGLNMTYTPMARQQYLATTDQFASMVSDEVLRAYRRPSDPGEMPSSLLRQPDALRVATELSALWSEVRRLYAMTVPLSRSTTASELEIGDVVRVSYPMEDLDDGQEHLGRIVGYALRSTDSQMAYSVLV